jgi:pSer/pThr/pTyr-binding forkhead associated (FHA) protein
MFVAVSAPVHPRARIVVERGESPPGTVFQLAAEEVQAGRSQGAVIFPSDPCLAPHHATFVQRGGQLVVRDEGAAGGIYVRIPTGQGVPLKPGGLFTAGDRLLRFAGTVPPAPPPPPDGTMRLGAPRPEGPAVLLEEWLEGGVGGRVWMRAGPSITVGRAGCSVNLGDDAYLSQAHAEIVVESDGTASLRDLGSSNGTFVRVPPGGDAPLRDGDELRLGREVLRVEVR